MPADQILLIDPNTSEVLTLEAFQKQYTKWLPLYQRLTQQVSEASKSLLKNCEIPFLDVTYRVKDVDSGYKKFNKPDKNYLQPFVDITDWCGIRIICYYTSDIDKICDIVRREFHISSYEDTAGRLMPDAFGYRSIHFIAEIKPEWMSAPTFRGLSEIKFEIQIRTILMHAWSEIEHKIKYKSTVEAPKQFQRQLYRLSAKFEESDEQFEFIRAGIEKYREELSNKKTTVDAFRTLDVNLETVQAFINLALPIPPYTIYSWYGNAGDVATRIQKASMNMDDVVNAFKQGEAAGKVASRAFQSFQSQHGDLPQIDTIQFILVAGSEMYYQVNIIQTMDPNPLYYGRNILQMAKSARDSVLQGIADGSIAPVS